MAPKRNQDLWHPRRIKAAELSAFTKKHHAAVVDETKQNLEELFLLRNPRYCFDKDYHHELDVFRRDIVKNEFGSWFYFPWLDTIVRYFPEELHYELRTGRNKNLITKEEQARFYNATIVYLGMSVGSHIAIVTAMTGGAKHVKLADPDTLSGDNLNRVRSGFQNVGLKKYILVARQLAEIDPYVEVEIFVDGITAENANNLLSGADIIVEEMDDPYWKLRSRELAKERGIPVIMGTDNGDGVIVDIERYDIEHNLPLLNGLIGDLSAEKLGSMPPKDLPKVAGKIAGANLTVPRMLESVAEVGKTLYSWPQLGTAANMCGTIGAYLIRRIVNKDRNIRSGRYVVNLDSTFESDYRMKWFSRKLALYRFIWKMMRRK